MPTKTRKSNLWSKMAGEYYREHKNDSDINCFSDVLKSLKFKAYYKCKRDGNRSKDCIVEESEIKVSKIKESEIKESEIKESEIKESEIKESEIKESEIKESEIKENKSVNKSKRKTNSKKGKKGKKGKKTNRRTKKNVIIDNFDMDWQEPPSKDDRKHQIKNEYFNGGKK
jgi:hypothetical protein